MESRREGLHSKLHGAINNSASLWPNVHASLETLVEAQHKEVEKLNGELTACKGRMQKGMLGIQATLS